MGQIMRLRPFAVCQFFLGNAIVARVLLHLFGTYALGLGRVQAENLRAQLRRERRVAVTFLEFRRDLKRA